MQADLLVDHLDAFTFRIPGGMEGHRFFVDLDGHRADTNIASAFEILEREARLFKIEPLAL